MAQSDIREKIQAAEYKIPYHYKDLFAPGQDVERKSLFSMALKEINASPGKSVLDIGCGDGRFCFHAKEECAVEGVDVDSRALAWARLFNPEVAFHEKMLQELPEESYDGIVCLEVIEHISDEILPSFLTGIQRVVKSDGIAFFSVPSINQPLSSKHYKHYTGGMFDELLSGYFSEVAIGGHAVTKSFYRKPFSILNLFSCLFYSPNFCNKFPGLVKKVTGWKEDIWYNHLHTAEPERCDRIIAICKK